MACTSGKRRMSRDAQRRALLPAQLFSLNELRLESPVNFKQNVLNDCSPTLKDTATTASISSESAPSGWRARQKSATGIRAEYAALTLSSYMAVSATPSPKRITSSHWGSSREPDATAPRILPPSARTVIGCSIAYRPDHLDYRPSNGGLRQLGRARREYAQSNGHAEVPVINAAPFLPRGLR